MFETWTPSPEKSICTPQRLSTMSEKTAIEICSKFGKISQCICVTVTPTLIVPKVHCKRPHQRPGLLESFEY